MGEGGNVPVGNVGISGCITFVARQLVGTDFSEQFFLVVL